MTISPIDALVADLTPVRPVSAHGGYGLASAATAITVLGLAFLYGLRTDLISGTPHPLVIVRGGMLLVLGLAALSAVIASARPSVGQTSTGWRWALAAAALFPITAAILSFTNSAEALSVISSRNAIWCLVISSVNALFIGGLLTAWLRQGAPTAINRTAWLVGLAAGSFGTFSYSLYCPSTTVYYVGFWYSLAIMLSVVTARLVVPRLIQW